MENDGWCVPALAYCFSTNIDKRKSVFFISFNCHILKSFSIFFFLTNSRKRERERERERRKMKEYSSL